MIGIVFRIERSKVVTELDSDEEFCIKGSVKEYILVNIFSSVHKWFKKTGNIDFYCPNSSSPSYLDLKCMSSEIN